MQNKTALTDICNLVWLDLIQVQNFELFLSILASIIELVQKALTGFQKSQMFNNILDKFNQLFQSVELVSGKNQEIFDRIEEFLKQILERADDVSEIIAMDPFI